MAAAQTGGELIQKTKTSPITEPLEVVAPEYNGGGAVGTSAAPREVQKFHSKKTKEGKGVYFHYRWKSTNGRSVGNASYGGWRG